MLILINELPLIFDLVNIPVYWFCLQTSVLGSIRSASCSSMKRLYLSRCTHLNYRTGTESKNSYDNLFFKLKYKYIFKQFLITI